MMQDQTPADLARAVVTACADCDVCRYLMADTSCQFFPELYRLADREAGGGPSITAEELQQLVELCNFCAICPCPNIRTEIMQAKRAFVARKGLPRALRSLEDVERLSRWAGCHPRLSNWLTRWPPTAALVKRWAGIHPERRLPQFPEVPFDRWAKREGLQQSPSGDGRRVALFVGCTGRFLFPAVPQAAVTVLRRLGLQVFIPEQRCCGLPSLLEGDKELTFSLVTFNLPRLAKLVAEGYDLVCSCPSCSFVLKRVWREGADYAPEVGGEPAVLVGLLRDDGYFASLSPQQRLLVAQRTYDLGEYLLELLQGKAGALKFRPSPGRLVYFPPCHLREQGIGTPYGELLPHIPGVEWVTISGSFYCCGMAGIMGFKRQFHAVSLAIAQPLAARIREAAPDRLLCDCLSCRLQFQQLLPYPVYHPIEILATALA